MPELSRRRALTAAAVLATAAGVPAVTALTASAAGPDHHGPTSFDEVYKGRRIQGGPAAGGAHHHHGGGYAVFVDGVELHVMRNADGSWISVVSHYDPVPTPRAAARAAVDELQGAALLPFPAN
ncbi:tyrosinase [Streptomyces viridochromogenes]|uniref:Tyrosinase n=1 Tax=Streptomyces viridochromogenes TaxID=1938 RepID=A0A0J8C7N3_STRVR|nr:tyrosinase cofactor [Streptomyces viridochromogenes]KMS73910.1 tyrosinase [Streptomyces viridochromogenes]KOG10981.1 tyrosinase [Streptomyces viridochromogenes]KOG26082.1 tyrosinase [Streptomyces viridochromogenes]